MDENCKRQKEVERTYGGLLPAVEGHSLGTRYKVHMRVVVNLMNVKQCTMSFIIVIMFLVPKYPLHTLQLYQAQSPNNGIIP